MKASTAQRCLVIYSGVLTIALSTVLLLGARKPDPNASFDQIIVHRINVVEPDGTTRMVISDKAEFPGSFYKGKEYPRPDRKTAGMLFTDDEGTENGGLVFGGQLGEDGKGQSYGHLSFDEYQRDQTAVMDSNSGDSTRATTFRINDDDRSWALTPEISAEMNRIAMMPAGTEQNAAWNTFYSNHPGKAINRGIFARNRDKSVSLTLKDTDGQPRLVARVTADGTPVIQFLDAKGNVLRTIGADKQ